MLLGNAVIATPRSSTRELLGITRFAMFVRSFGGREWPSQEKTVLLELRGQNA